MCGSHCRGCHVCPASLLGGRGERMTILQWPSLILAVGRARGLFMKAPPCMSTNMARGNLQKWGLPSLRGSFSLFVIRGGSPVRDASHKPEIWSQQKSPFPLIFKFSEPVAFVLGCYMIQPVFLKFEGKSLWNFFMLWKWLSLSFAWLFTPCQNSKTVVPEPSCSESRVPKGCDHTLGLTDQLNSLHSRKIESEVIEMFRTPWVLQRALLEAKGLSFWS